jgi:hypothetical protein
MMAWIVIDEGIEVARFDTADEALVACNHYNESKASERPDALAQATVEPVGEI